MHRVVPLHILFARLERAAANFVLAIDNKVVGK